MITIKELETTIHNLLEDQKFGVFASSRNETPHTTLVSFVASEDLTKIVYATPRTTRKIINSQIFPRVSLVVDTRTNNEVDIKGAVALAAIGKAQILESNEKTKYRELYLGKHPYLGFFFNSPSVDLVEITVDKYEYVSSFQRVFDWVPPSPKNPEGLMKIRQQVGTPLSGGYYRGKVKIMKDSQASSEQSDKDVLILANFNNIDQSKIQSYSAILIQENYEKSPLVQENDTKTGPIVSNIPNLLELVNDGDDITVDGYLGIVIFHGVR